MGNNRLYYLDWLRGLTILTLIPYHAALTYTGLGDIYVKTPVTGIEVIPFIFVTMPLDNFFMALLFFVSGASCYHTMSNKDTSTFVIGRAKKLLLPFILGTFVLCPIQAFSMALHNGITRNFIEFLPMFFSGNIADYLGYAHLWFLIYLFVFTAFCLPVFRYLVDNQNIRFSIGPWLSRGNNIYLPFVWVVFLEALLRPLYPGKQTLIFDWANDAVYLSMLFMGFVYASDEKIQVRLDRLMKPAASLVTLSLFTLFATYYAWLVLDMDSLVITRVWAVSKGVYEPFMIILLLCVTRRYLNLNNNLLKYLNGSSFFYYLFHLVIVTYVTLALSTIDINLYLKYITTIMVSYLVLAIAYKTSTACQLSKKPYPT